MTEVALGLTSQLPLPVAALVMVGVAALVYGIGYWVFFRER